MMKCLAPSSSSSAHSLHDSEDQLAGRWHLGLCEDAQRHLSGRILMFGRIRGASGGLPVSCCPQERRGHYHHRHSHASPSALTRISENTEWEKVKLREEQDWPGEQ